MTKRLRTRLPRTRFERVIFALQVRRLSHLANGACNAKQVITLCVLSITSYLLSSGLFQVMTAICAVLVGDKRQRDLGASLV